MTQGANHRRQRTPRFRSVCIPRQWRGAAAAERSRYRMEPASTIQHQTRGPWGTILMASMASLVFYVLSVGPAARLLYRRTARQTAATVLETIYARLFGFSTGQELGAGFIGTSTFGEPFTTNCSPQPLRTQFSTAGRDSLLHALVQAQSPAAAAQLHGAKGMGSSGG